MLEIDYEKRSLLRVKEQLKLLGLDRKARQKLLKRIGPQIVKITRKNIRAQRDPEGKAWKQRQKGRKKMLKGFKKIASPPLF